MKNLNNNNNNKTKMNPQAEKLIAQVRNLGQKNGNCGNRYITKEEIRKVMKVDSSLTAEEIIQKAKEISLKRQEREERKAKKSLPLPERFELYLKGALPGSPFPYDWTSTCDSRKGKIIDRDIPGRLFLIRHEEIYHYSNRYGWYPVEACWLGGVDDGQHFITRVPATVKTVKEALEFLKPKEARKAEKEGKRIIRQGDVWFIEAKKDNFRYLPRNHKWNPETRTVTHPQHTPVHLPFPVFAIPNRVCTSRGVQVANGKSGRRIFAD